MSLASFKRRVQSGRRSSHASHSLALRMAFSLRDVARNRNLVWRRKAPRPKTRGNQERCFAASDVSRIVLLVVISRKSIARHDNSGKSAGHCQDVLDTAPEFVGFSLGLNLLDALAEPLHLRIDFLTYGRWIG
jgi:hypothetical protein